MCAQTLTGSDTNPSRTLSKALQEFGVVGEGVIDERVHVVKTHFPERRGFAEFEADRAILLVRNPYDVIDSYFNMTLTNSHNTTMHESQYERFEDLFTSLAVAEVEVWRLFNKWWLRTPLPLLVVRYEDLVLHLEQTLRRIGWFLNGQQTIRGTPCEARIAEICEQSIEDVGPYRPRNGGGTTIGAALRHFKPTLRAHIEEKSSAKVMLREFGYAAAGDGGGFPTNVAIAPRAVRLPVPAGDNKYHRLVTSETTGRRRLVVNVGDEIRGKDSPFGRYMTTLRKSLVDPVISDAGVELNMHEVELARAAAAVATVAVETTPPPSVSQRPRKSSDAKNKQASQYPCKEQLIRSINAPRPAKSRSTSPSLPLPQ